jgi:lysylphosphatidylglycerol synthetase-like protein (DUF2156 family)
MLGGLAYTLGPDRLWVGPVLLVAMGLLVLGEIRGTGAGGRNGRPPHVALTVFTVLALAGLVAIFSTTYIGEPLAGRFVVFAGLSLALVVIAAGGWAPRGRRRQILTIVAVLLTAVAMYRLGVKYHLAGREQPVEALNVTISPSYWTGPPRVSGPDLLVAPPTYPWQQRSGLR